MMIDDARAAGLAIHQQQYELQQALRRGTAGGMSNSDVGSASSNSVPVTTKETKKGNVRQIPPTILPLRRPSSENPEILNRREFGENQDRESNERCATNAEKLGLDKKSEKTTYMLIQLPPYFPFPQGFFESQQSDTCGSAVPTMKAGSSAKGKEIDTSSPASSESKISPPRNIATAPRLPPTPLGKLLVYESGKVKWKMGDLLFNVSPGNFSDTMLQDAVSINTKEKEFYRLGAIENRMVVTPDFSALLDKEGSKQ